MPRRNGSGRSVSENPDSRRRDAPLRIFIHHRYISSSVPRIGEAAERLYQRDPMILFRMLYRGFREDPFSVIYDSDNPPAMSRRKGSKPVVRG